MKLQRNVGDGVKRMGNNEAFRTFQVTVIILYNHEVLTLAILDELAEEWRGPDIDRGGDTDITAENGKSLEEICIALVYPRWRPTINDDLSVYDDPDEWYDEEMNRKFDTITNDRWGWG
jgi:hypothetical protein